MLLHVTKKIQKKQFLRIHLLAFAILPCFGHVAGHALTGWLLLVLFCPDFTIIFLLSTTIFEMSHFICGLHFLNFSCQFSSKIASFGILHPQNECFWSQLNHCWLFFTCLKVVLHSFWCLLLTLNFWSQVCVGHCQLLVVRMSSQAASHPKSVSWLVLLVWLGQLVHSVWLVWLVSSIGLFGSFSLVSLFGSVSSVQFVQFSCFSCFSCFSWLSQFGCFG